jgi:ribosomal protein S18 acetylase RimI-like enzyme
VPRLLDKSIPYYNIIMKYKAGTAVPAPELPAGYQLRYYRPGDEWDWANIEAAVGEFDTAEEALRYFNEQYLPHADQLGSRCIFIQSNDGSPAATCTAWWDSKEGLTIPSLHWVGVHPRHQHKGLGKAIVFQCMQDMAALEPGRDVWLHTQTWSYRAIGIYFEAGFEIMREDTFDGHINEYALARPLLAAKLKPQYLNKIR